MSRGHRWAWPIVVTVAALVLLGSPVVAAAAPLPSASAVQVPDESAVDTESVDATGEYIDAAAASTPKINVDYPTKLYYGTVSYLTVTITATPVATGSITIRRDGTPIKSAALKAGKVRIALPSKMSIGRHQIQVSYSGNSRIASFSTDFTATVLKAKPKISIAATSVSRGVSPQVTVKVTGPVTAGGKVTVRMAGKQIGTAGLKSGVARMTLPNDLAVGSHQLSVAYSGSRTLAAGTATASLVVLRPTPEMEAALTTEGTYYNLTVGVAALGTAATGSVRVQLTGSGPDTAVSADLAADGSATLHLDKLPRGSYTIAISYLGDPEVAPVTRHYRLTSF